ncbi:SdpA family antimicrobial peptide system protein [Streptosporangium amethystogenes]|uniref:SdpA family antimicrobial peptide system protein n=1 Tax=Streptosporangium amethystogenes TaxID=2002 RepID=UPI003791A16C
MNADVRLGISTVALGLGWTALILYVVIGQLPSAALRLPAQRTVSEAARLVAPQGWAFFTKSAREPRETLWRASATGAWQPVTLGPHAEPRNLWGFDRRSRAEGVERGILLAAVPADRWRDCRSEVTGCLGLPGAAVPVRNPSPDPILCGTLEVTRQKPLPWAWADAATHTHMPVSVVRLEVAC